MTGRKVKSPKSTGKVTRQQASKAVKAVKLTDKQEAFCQAYVKCNNQSEAYRQSYDVGKNTKPKTMWEAACRIMADSKVSARVFELQEIAQERTLVTVESLTKELEDSHAMAKSEKQAAAMTGATMGKAKLHGLDVQNINLTGHMAVSIDSEDADL